MLEAYGPCAPISSESLEIWQSDTRKSLLYPPRCTFTLLSTWSTCFFTSISGVSPQCPVRPGDLPTIVRMRHHPIRRPSFCLIRQYEAPPLNASHTTPTRRSPSTSCASSTITHSTLRRLADHLRYIAASSRRLTDCLTCYLDVPPFAVYLAAATV